MELHDFIDRHVRNPITVGEEKVLICHEVVNFPYTPASHGVSPRVGKCDTYRGATWKSKSDMFHGGAARAPEVLTNYVAQVSEAQDEAPISEV